MPAVARGERIIENLRKKCGIFKPKTRTPIPHPILVQDLPVGIPGVTFRPMGVFLTPGFSTTIVLTLLDIPGMRWTTIPTEQMWRALHCSTAKVLHINPRLTGGGYFLPHPSFFLRYLPKLRLDHRQIFDTLQSINLTYPDRRKTR